MAATADKVYISICDESKKWIEGQIAKPTDRLALVMAYNKKRYVMPLKCFENKFDDLGYGQKKTILWLARWKYLEKIDWIDYNSIQRYVVFNTLAISERELDRIVDAIDRSKKEEKEKMEALKAEMEAKEQKVVA